jgi:hypothetical protein
MTTPSPKQQPAAPKPGDLANRESRARQLQEQRRRENATRSTLSRLRNRKSDLK